MTDDLVKRLRTEATRKSWSAHVMSDGTTVVHPLMREAADYIEHQHASHNAMVEEIERLTRERDAHVSGWMKQCEVATAAIKRAEAAERKVEKLRDALLEIEQCYGTEPWELTKTMKATARAALKETENE